LWHGLQPPSDFRVAPRNKLAGVHGRRERKTRNIC
jgi:hypothetical protein